MTTLYYWLLLIFVCLLYATGIWAMWAYGSFKIDFPQLKEDKEKEAMRRFYEEQSRSFGITQINARSDYPIKLTLNSLYGKQRRKQSPP